MSRSRTAHRCSECGVVAARWSGRCASCGAWNSLVEETPLSRSSPEGSRPVPLAEVAVCDAEAYSSGLTELDRVLGGGLVPGSVTLLGGEPGIGKSTLLLQSLIALAARGRRCLLASAEESPAQVRRRAERLGVLPEGLWLVGETSLAGVEEALIAIRPDVVVVDSIQTVWDPDLGSPAGSVVQVRSCAHRLAARAKGGGPAMLLVGHVTKDGNLAGPRVVEHLVDTVLLFEGDRHYALRTLRAVKHRFGPVGEVGLFEMTAAGLEGLSDPGGLFMAGRRPEVPGSVVFAGMQGRRPVLVEIQALVLRGPEGARRAVTSGFDQGRLGLLFAVLDQRAGLDLRGRDVYVSVAGGLRVADPGADLAVCVAVASAATGRPLPSDPVVLGEVGLGGELRQVPGTTRRLAEAARLGFAGAVVPCGSPPAETGLKTLTVGTLGEALERCLGRPIGRPRLQLVGS